MNPDNFTNLASITAAGATGSGATWWLSEVNPWLAFVSGILTIVFMSMSIFKLLKK